MRTRDLREPPWLHEPWQHPRLRSGRQRPHRRHITGPAAIGAALFHVLGARDLAADGGVYRPMDVLTYAILLAGPVALLWRRKAPITALTVATAASIGFALIAAPRWVYLAGPLIALFAAAKAGRARTAALVAVGGYALWLALLVVAEAGIDPGTRPSLREAVLTGAALLVTLFLGSAAKVQSEHQAEIAKARAERTRAREEQERRQASEERLRMARELHDVLGHHLSLISVQAGVGLHLMDTRPEQAREALTAIRTASSEALREVRAVLGVLRPEEEAAPRQPALGLDRLDELTGDDAGLAVTVTRTGTPRPLPAEVDRAAYRIVQEALTNVRKHAPPTATAEVVVEFRPAQLHLSIANSGAEAADTTADSGGSGIAGMRARAVTLGGALTAGPRPGGGFQVTATLPAPVDEGDTA